MVTGGGEGKWIHRNWMFRAITSISVIRVQTVFQTGVWFCYKCSRQTGVWFWRKLGYRQHFGFLFTFQFFARIPKGIGVGVVGSLSFDVQRWGVPPNSESFGQTEKRGRGSAKIGHLSWIS